MKNLKLLGISITLLCILSMSAFAGDTNSPPCAAGDTNSPPCSSAPLTSGDPSGETNSVVAPSTEAEYSIAEVVADLLMNSLLLF